MLNRNVSAALLALVCSAVSATPADDFRITGPFTHENLSVYLLHRASQQTATNLLTLGEAMEQKKTIVYETGNVQELSIENVSTQPVFVQAGDIVKGGQQDRVLTTDLLLAPHSGKLPIASFCVEQGRWTKRGAEPAEQFNAAALAVPTRALKIAVREPGNQTKVWSEVAEARIDLAAATGSGGGVGSGTGGVYRGGGLGAPSTTSMEMALEDRKVTEAVDRYISALSKIIDKDSDTVGYAYTVNGKFSGADVYASADFFRRMWPKLLKSSAADALAERSKGTAAGPPEIATIRAALMDADSGRATAPRINGSLSVTKKESNRSLLFTTADRNAAGAWLHKSYIAR